MLKKRGFKAGLGYSEPTGGNTGIGLASVAAARGYRIILTMPETMSIERVPLKAYGAEIVLTEAQGYEGCHCKGRRTHKNTQLIYTRQFIKIANPAATGPESGMTQRAKVDIFVSGIGTGGILLGLAVLKIKNPGIKVCCGARWFGAFEGRFP